MTHNTAAVLVPWYSAGQSGKSTATGLNVVVVVVVVVVVEVEVEDQYFPL